MMTEMFCRLVEYRFAASSTNDKGEISALSTRFQTRIQGGPP